MKNSLKITAIFTTVVMFILMIAGSLVTNTGSALGCGNDWPLCNGKLVPEYTLATMIEYTHRLITAFAGILVLAFSIWAWIRYSKNREVKILSIMSITFIIIESLLGASAVIWPQSPAALALHFGLSLIAFTGVFLLSMFVIQKDRPDNFIKGSVTTNFKWLTWFTLLFTYCDIYLGAYVRHKGASLACTDFPACYGNTLIPELSGTTGIHFAHRFAALVLFILIICILVSAIKQYKETRRDIYYASIVAFALTIAQIISGIFVVIFSLNIISTLSHSAFITALFGTLSYICLQTLKENKQ
ncbi:heme A synthase [Bacillus toyonensis]|uniref:COX15/CtaA family protein n=1 Tax=Bacillus toyonensis TaxID=155322 RepID=UPI003466A97F